MIKQLKTGTGVVAGLAALALGGSAIAGAASGTPAKAHPAHEMTTAQDADNIQSGDQTTPDAGTTKAELSTSETSSETSSESTVTDGPGGYADPAGSNADTQQQGQY